MITIQFGYMFLVYDWLEVRFAQMVVTLCSLY